MTKPDNDIPEDIEDAIERLRDFSHDVTRTERAFMCGYLTAMQQARDMLQELELEDLPPVGLSQ